MADRESLIERLDPRIKRVLVLAIFAAVAISIVLLFAGKPKTRTVEAKKQDIVRDILTDTDTGALGVEGLIEQMRKLRAENRRIQEQLEHLQERTAQEREKHLKALQKLNEGYELRMRQLTERLERTVQEQSAVAVKQAEKVAQQQAEKVAGQARHEQTGHSAPRPEGTDLRNIFAGPPSVAPAAPPNAKPGAPPQSTSLAIKEIESEKPKEAVGEKPEGEDNEVFIPAGSIVTGVLLNGMDAGTGHKARKDPQPVLLRIKHDAIMPNRYRADIKECAILLSGYGELSSERVFLRTETLTCVREDGGVIEVPIDGYAVGEDGKTGIRGRLVSRQGQYLAKAAVAGFAEGFAQIFTKQQVPVIATTATGTTPFQSALSAEGIESAALSGAGSALERLSDFYMDMAEHMFPVIEIDGGRRIDIIINRGARLKIVGL